jgi:hypothetical protein
MATVISFNTVDGYGVMKVWAKSGEKIRFPQPSKVADPQVFVNANGKRVSVIRKSNIGFTVKTEKDKEMEIFARYQIY